MPSSRIVVIGAGATGAFTAFWLARAGASVTLVERDRVAAHASGRNPGGLNPMHGPGIPGPLEALALEAFRLHTERRDEIGRLSSLDFSASPVARLDVALEGDDLAALTARAALYESTPGFSARLLERRELTAVEPRLTPGAIAALSSTGNARVSSAVYVRAVVRAAVRLGASFLSGEATELRLRAGRVAAVVVGSSTIACDGVVLATGPWGARLAEQLGVELGVEPVKGELLLVEAADGGLSVDVTRGAVGVYLAPRGQLWLGGTEDHAGLDERPTREGRDRILAGIEELLPGLDLDRVVAHVAGLRPATADDLPLLGLLPGYENVCVADGAGRKGLLLSAALGLAAAELTTRGETDLPVEACSLERIATPAR